MDIGIVFDLREAYLERGMTLEETAEFDSQETVLAIEESLISLGHRVERIGGAKELLSLLAYGRRWDLVFNIAEGIRGKFRESIVPAMLELYGIPYTFSDPLSTAITLDKGTAKKLILYHGIRTPEFCLVSSPHEIDRIGLDFPLFVKPNQEGTGKGIDEKSIVRDSSSLRERIEALLFRFGQPVLVEEYLPGREFTVGVVGEGESAWALGTMEIRVKGGYGVYSFRAKEECESLVEYLDLREDGLRSQVEEVAIGAYRALGLRDLARIDIKLSQEGVPMFLEANPLPGLHPTHSDLPMIAKMQGWSFRDLIAYIITSASKRLR
ncbi:MAG: D-alanine--D-alanine ligase [Desulfatiglandales bacterium]